MDSSIVTKTQQINPIRTTGLELLAQAYLTDGIADQLIPIIYYENAQLIERRLAKYYSREAMELGIIKKSTDIISAFDLSPTDDYIRQLVRIALFLSQRTHSGYYALSFNKRARGAITDYFSLKICSMTPEEFFPEASKDPIIQERARMEEQALVLAFKEAISMVSVKFFRSDGELELYDDEADDLFSQNWNRLTLSTQCYERSKSTPETICLFSDIEIEKMPEGVPEGTPIPRTFCLETRELLVHLLTDQINPITGLKFSEKTLSELNSRHDVQLKIMAEHLFSGNFPPK